MPPEEIAALAAAQGLAYTPGDLSTIVHHPSGDMEIAHPPVARTFEPPLPAPDRVPPSLARPPDLTPPASIATSPQQQRADSLRRQGIEQRQAYDRQQAEQQRQQSMARDWAEMDAQHEDYVRTRGDQSEPDQYGIVTRTYPGGRTERTGPPGAFEAEAAAQARQQREMQAYTLRHTPTSAGTTTFPDGSTVTTDDQGRSVMPPVDMERLRAELAGGGRGAMGESDAPILAERLRGLGLAAGDAWRGVASPEVQGAVAPVTDALGAAVAPASAAAQAPSDGVPPMLARPTGDYAPPVAPVGTPSATPRRGGGGGGMGRPQPAPMTLPGALDQLAGTPQARQAFDGTIAGLAQGGPQARREADLIDRQMLLEQQRAGLATKAAGTQAQIEQQAEQQRQQLEQDRQRAIQGAQQRYQNAIQRVSDAHLDPSRWFRDQGAAGTVTATIAVALGALGQAFSGSSTNSALDQINQAIDRDMTAQQSEIDAARAGADLTGNMLSITRQEFSDRQAASDAARAAMLQQAALHVQEMEGSLAGQEAQQNAEAMRAQLASQAAEAQAAAEERQSQIDLRHAQTLRELGNAQIAQTRADRMARGGGGPAAPHITSAMLSTADAIFRAGNGELTREDAARLAGIPESAGFTPRASPEADTQRQRGPLNTALSALESAIPAEGDIPGVGVADSRAPGWMLSDEGRRMRSLAQRTLIRMLRVDSGGVIGPDEIAQYGDMYGLTPGSTEQQFRDGVRAMRADFDAGILGSPHSGAATDHEHAAVGFTPE